MEILKDYGSMGSDDSSDDQDDNNLVDNKERPGASSHQHDETPDKVVHDFFGLAQNSDDDEPKTKRQKHDQSTVVIGGHSVELPNTNFWKGFSPTDNFLDTEACEAPHLNLLKTLNTDDDSAVALDDWSCTSHMDRLHNKFPVNKHESKSHESTNIMSTRCNNYKSQTEVNQLQTNVMDETSCKRKLYFVHAKISPRLHNMSKTFSNMIPKKIEKKLKVHGGVVNRVKWNTKHSYSHLFLSASMDRTVKIWNIWTQLDPCVKTLSIHSKAVKDAEWSSCGKKILSCSYDRTAVLTDVETATSLATFHHATFVSSGQFHPVDHNMLLTGANNIVMAWDARSPESPCRTFSYKDNFGQVQDLLFSRDGGCFFSCSDVISRDSADRTIMAWDFGAGVILSNQIFQERYICTRLRLHPTEGNFFAQTQGDYIAIFSVNKPYKMNRSKRFDKHKVVGYGIGFDLTPDGSTVISGSSDGKLYCYNYQSAKLFRTLNTGLDICMDAAFHPVLPSTLVCCGWNGEIQVWS